MIIECIKGFQVAGGPFPIMAGERFELVDIDNSEFKGTEQSQFPEMLICFYDEQLANNFRFVVGSH